MPISIKPELASRVFRAPVVSPELPVQEAEFTSFPDLVRMVAEGIADAQASLDRASAELVTELASTKIKIIPRITETIDKDGNVTFEQAPEREVSLLDIGVTPTFYQFSQATIEVAMDLKIVENINESGVKRGFALFANTSGIRFERKLNRDVSVSSKLTATLVPVPKPLRIEPERSTNTETE